LFADDQNLTSVSELKLASGNRNSVEIHVGFSAEWNGYTKSAVFFTDRDSTVYEMLMEDDKCIVPSEVLSSHGVMYVGVRGVTPDAVKTTFLLRYRVAKGAPIGTGTAVEPTSDLCQQILKRFDSVFLPEVDESANGKFLCVVDGKWQVADSVSGEVIAQIQADIAELKYVPIDITSISNNVGTKEMGSSVDSVTVSWAVNKEPKSQTVHGESVDVSARSKTIPGPFSTNQSFAVAVTDEKGKTDTASTSISFLNGVYYGVLADGAEVDSAAILSLTRKLQGSKGMTFTANAGASQRIVYALPTRYGTPNFNVGGFDGGFEKAKTFDFTNASGYTESYDVWLSSNVGLGSTTVNVT
jgi:hypothetical protein